MKILMAVSTGVINGISLLHVLLFVYAAVSKLLDFENFQVQLGQSPLVGAFAGILAWGVPLGEIAIALLLLVPASRFAGLLLGFCLMVSFSAYIYIILNFSESIPCSCGGILEKLGWKEHLWFNLSFVFLSALGLVLFNVQKQGGIYRPVLQLSLAGLISIGGVAWLYHMSDHITRYGNTFIRNFPMAANKLTEADLGYNSYYFAGYDREQVFLGNVTAPLQMVAIRQADGKRSDRRITLDKTDLPFRAVKTKIAAPYFYVYDGTVGCIYRGELKDWQAQLRFRQQVFIDQLIPTGPDEVIIRTQEPAEGTRTGIVRLGSPHPPVYTGVLEKRGDGIFEVDGTFVYDQVLGRAVYVYAYRNQFTVTDSRLVIKSKGKTIDTIAHPKLEVRQLRDKGQLKLARPPLKVNRSAAVYDGMLFINSGIMGRYEPEEMWKVASIIDVYRLSDNAYITSFYIHDVDRKKMSGFIVTGNRLYALVGNALVTYNLSTLITSRYKSKNSTGR